jgi:hypothetical protein
MRSVAKLKLHLQASAPHTGPKESLLHCVLAVQYCSAWLVQD